MIEREERDGISYLTMVHGRANAWDLEFLDAFRAALDGSAAARAVVITARGKIFCAGVDLPRLLADGVSYVERFIPLMNTFCRELFAFPAPVISSVNGHAIAGGGILALSSDYVLMTDGGARIGIPELTVGVPFPTVPLEIVRHGVPGNRLRSVVFSGRTFTPAEAVDVGLVDEVVGPDQLEARTAEVAASMAAIPSAAFRLTKRALRADALTRMDRGIEGYAAESTALWSDPATHAHLRDYLARSLGGGKSG
jgi:enoyl-CoA hydratase